MSNRHPQLQVFVETWVRGGEHAFGGIRDGGKRGRRSSMYDFLRRHKDGRGLTPGTSGHRFYLECLEHARELSRPKSQRS